MNELLQWIKATTEIIDEMYSTVDSEQLFNYIHECYDNLAAEDTGETIMFDGGLFVMVKVPQPEEDGGGYTYQVLFHGTGALVQPDQDSAAWCHQFAPVPTTAGLEVLPVI